MAFWYRIKQSQLKSLSNQFKRYYFQIHGPCSFNHTASRENICVFDKPSCFIHKSQFEFCHNVRFFAAPVQVKPKQEEKDTSGPRLNEQITAAYVRLVTDDGHGVVSRREALECARKLNLDLVEVQRTAKPPVCKLMDYHKEKYKQQVKEKDRAKSKSELTLRKGDCKEVRFAGKIEQKDLQMKADMVKRLMERGYRVKCMAMGSEDQDLEGLLSRLSALIEDVSIVESGPRVEKRQAYVIVRHAKFGPSKKGSGKKASKLVEATSAEIKKVAISAPTISPSAQSSIQFEENLDAAGSVLENEDDILSEEACSSPSLNTPDVNHEENKSAWSVFDASDDFDTVFDVGDNVNGIAKGSTCGQIKTPAEMSSSRANTSSEFLSPRPVIDSSRTHAAASSPSEAPLGTENRYRREPRDRFPPTRSPVVKGTGARDSTRLGTQFPNQGRQPRFDLNASPPARETERVESEASILRNLKLPANEFPQQETSRPIATSSPAPSYGIFSTPKSNDTPGKQCVPAEDNRYKKGTTFDSTRNPSSVGVSANSNSPASKSDGSRRPVANKEGQGKWGIFSRES